MSDDDIYVAGLRALCYLIIKYIVCFFVFCEQCKINSLSRLFRFFRVIFIVILYRVT